MMEGKVTRRAFKDVDEDPRHTRLADVYDRQRSGLFQGWGPKMS
jgi:hypothetical protein